MIKHLMTSLVFLLLCSSSTNFSMQQQLMQRNNFGKNDSQDIREQKIEEKNFSDLTFKEIVREKCVICHEKLKRKDEAITILACQHTLHDDCFGKLKKYNFTNCPTCKANIVHSQDEEDEDENSCIACIVKTKKYMIHGIENLSGELIKESRDCMSSPQDYVERHLLFLRSLLNNLWGSHSEE